MLYCVVFSIVITILQELWETDPGRLQEEREVAMIYQCPWEAQNCVFKDKKTSLFTLLSVFRIAILLTI